MQRILPHRHRASFGKIYPFVATCIAVWVAWGLITFTERMYYAKNPELVLFLWAKVRTIQALNGIWITLLLFLVYRRIVKKEISRPLKTVYVIFLTYSFSLGLVLMNMTVYRYFFEKATLMVAWERYLVVAFSKFFVILLLSILYFYIHHLRELQQQREKTLTAMAVANEAQLQMLRYQLNPHFLFNALNSIQTLVHEDARKAEKTISDLSDFLRYTLARENDQEATLADEIAVINNYLEIQKIRFEEKLLVEVNVTDEACKVKIPCFLIHPLVENSVKYGLVTSKPPLRIRIVGKVEDNTLDIVVGNTGQLNIRKKVEGNNTGLKNIQMRLHHFFPDCNHFRLYEEEGWVCARIQIQLNGENVRV